MTKRIDNIAAPFVKMLPRIICQHVAEQPQLALHGTLSSNRMCCTKCYKEGFLVKILETTEIKGKLVGTIKKGTK